MSAIYQNKIRYAQHRSNSAPMPFIIKINLDTLPLVSIKEIKAAITIDGNIGADNQYDEQYDDEWDRLMMTSSELQSAMDAVR